MKTLSNYILICLIIFGCGQQIGTQGPSGPQGIAGATGAQGQPGAIGPQGPVGIPAINVYVVQLCSQYTPVYGLFPEVAICIQGNLYAEYYAPPSSGLTMLSLGNYESTQTGAPCNFTVETNCIVEDY